MNQFFKLFTITCILLNLTTADEEGEISFKGIKTFYEFGSIVEAIDLGTDSLENHWVQRFGGFFDLEAHRGNYLNLYLGAGVIFWHAVPTKDFVPAANAFFGDAVLTKGYLHSHFGDTESPSVEVKLGVFPKKYSHSRNLGEYLFRSGAYPNYIITGNPFTVVNSASASVVGTEVTHRIGGLYEHSFLLTSERTTYPLFDFSLTYMGGVKNEMFSLGAGLMFSRLIPVTPSRTTPPMGKGRNRLSPLDDGGYFRRNTYFEYLGQNYTFNSGYYNHLARAEELKGNAVGQAEFKRIAGMVDSLFTHWDSGGPGRPEMKFYTFKSINPMVHASLNLGALINSESIKNVDFLIYMESVLLGIQDKPIYFENRMERLAIMFGINIPTFGIFDVLNLEMEYWPSSYVNGYRAAREESLPLPDYSYDKTKNYYDPDEWKSDDVKLSLFLERRIINGIVIQTQIARDHMRTRKDTRVVSEQSILVDDKHWYYMFKIQASI